MPEKLSYEEFLESLRLAPRLVVELVIENEKREILLLKRDKEPFKGHWHLPGGFLLKDERIEDCTRRTAQDELNIKEFQNSEKLGLFETIGGDPRGHILHYVVRLKTKTQPEGEYFAKLPQNTIFYQRVFLVKLGYK